MLLIRQAFLGHLEANHYRVNLHCPSLGCPGPQQRPPIESSNGVCLVASHASSYIQTKDLLGSLSKTCQDLGRPLVLVALETATAKTFRQCSGLQGRKILLWDTKSFWPSLRASIPPSTISPTKAVNKSNPDEETWTYVRKTEAAASGDSSLSTQSTDTMLATSRCLVNQRQVSNTLRIGKWFALGHNRIPNFTIRPNKYSVDFVYILRDAS